MWIWAAFGILSCALGDFAFCLSLCTLRFVLIAALVLLINCVIWLSVRLSKYSESERMENDAENDVSLPSFSSERSVDDSVIDDERNEAYRLKFTRLQLRCDEIQGDNERLINHIYQVKRIVHRYKKQRRFVRNFC